MKKSLRDLMEMNLESLTSFSRIKVVAVDLDGTMANSVDLDIWENVTWLVDRLKSRNTSLIVATGRTLTGARKAIELLYQKRDLPIILYNGSVVIKNKSFDILYKRVISTTTLHLVNSLADRFPVFVFAYFYLGREEQSLFNLVEQRELVIGFGEGERVITEFNGMPVVWREDILLGEIEPSAILIDIKKATESEQTEMIGFLSSLADISVTSSGFSYIEIRPANSDKAGALQFVSEYMKLTSNEFAAIGDNNNDVEMLKWAGIGIAVSNGTPSALEAARYICSHNVASGIIEVLRLIRQSKRYHNE